MGRFWARTSSYPRHKKWLFNVADTLGIFTIPKECVRQFSDFLVAGTSPTNSSHEGSYNYRHKLLGRFDHEQNFSKILFILSKYAVIT